MSSQQQGNWKSFSVLRSLLAAILATLKSSSRKVISLDNKSYMNFLFPCSRKGNFSTLSCSLSWGWEELLSTIHFNFLLHRLRNVRHVFAENHLLCSIFSLLRYINSSRTQVQRSWRRSRECEKIGCAQNCINWRFLSSQCDAARPPHRHLRRIEFYVLVLFGEKI